MVVVYSAASKQMPRRGGRGRGGRGYQGRRRAHHHPSGRGNRNARANAYGIEPSADWLVGRTREFANSAQSRADALERSNPHSSQTKAAKGTAKASWDALNAANLAYDAAKRAQSKSDESWGIQPRKVNTIKGISHECKPTRMEQKVLALGAIKPTPWEGDKRCEKCTFINFKRREVCFNCGVELPVQRNEKKFDVSLMDAFDIDVFLIAMKSLDMVNVARLACVCKDLRDLMKDPLIWTELMYRYLSSNCYKARLDHLLECSTRKPSHHGARRSVKLIVKNETSMPHEVWNTDYYRNKKIKVIYPGESSVINTSLDSSFAFVPTEKSFTSGHAGSSHGSGQAGSSHGSGQAGSSHGTAMRVLDRTKDVQVWGKTIRGVEWILRPRKPQPIKGMGKRYTQVECARYILSDGKKPKTVRAYRERKATGQKEVDRLEKEIKAKRIELERLENLQREARRKVGSAKYVEKVLTKTTW